MSQETYDAALADLSNALDTYEQILRLYAESICRCNAPRLEYLNSIELPFHLTPEVLVDLELIVNHIMAEQHCDLEVAA